MLKINQFKDIVKAKDTIDTMFLSGNVIDKAGNPLPSAVIEVKGEQFQTIYHTVSDESGRYSLPLPEGNYPFLTAVRDYGEKYLEYWCHNLALTENAQLDIRLDRLEIYGLNVFQVKGAYPALMVYFRPMSLTKFQNGDADIS